MRETLPVHLPGRRPRQAGRPRSLGTVLSAVALLLATMLSGCAGSGHVTSGAHAPHAAAPADLGVLRADAPVSALLGVRRKVADQAAQFAALAQPGNPDFGRYLSPAAVTAGYGADPAAVNRVRRRLAHNHLETAWHPGDGYVTVHGTAADVSRTFQVALHEYRSPDGQRYYASVGAPRVPDTLRPDATGVWQMSNAPTVHPLAVRPGGLTPPDVLTAYDIAPLRQRGFDGSGQTVILYAIDGFDFSDLDTFAQRFNLPPFDIEQHLIGSGSAPKPQGEATMDLEVVHAIAPRAKLAVYTLATGGSDSDYLALFRAGYEGHPRSIATASFGGCELQLGSNQNDINAEMARAGAVGVTIFASSGDSTGFDCYGSNWNSPPDANEVGVVFPAVLPAVTGVGGTRISQRSDGSYGGEVAWHEPARTTGTGGGISQEFSRPSWQTGTGTSGSGREVPDVAADSDPSSGMAIVINGHLAQGGGTSQAAPIWAGLATLVNGYLVAQHKPVLGFANPTFYRVAATATQAPPFHDITVGFNGVYSTGPGYDPVTGLGTPDAWNLARAVAALTGGSE